MKVNKFQSTLPRRERHMYSVRKIRRLKFQSTLPRRERPGLPPVHYKDHYFNPRSREGSDNFLLLHQRCICYFNPRSREGSDFCWFQYSGDYLISIHAPAKGATPSANNPSNGIRFQSTLPRRERPGTKKLNNLSMNFNPRSREGSD